MLSTSPHTSPMRAAAALLLALMCAAAAVAGSASALVMPPRELLKEEVAEMFEHAFGGYMNYAFPEDELKSLSCEGRRRGRDQSRGEMDNALGNYAMTLIDSLDSLAVFGRNEDFARAVKYISKEVTIRVLGGLLSGHMLAVDKQLNLLSGAPYSDELLKLAADLGDRLLPAFATPTGIPYSLVNLRRGIHRVPTTETCLAGAGTLQLEFTTLSLLTKDPKYARAVLQASRALWARRSRVNLVGSLIDVSTGQWRMGLSSVGAGSDSFYEYLLKMHVLTGDNEWLEMWTQSYDAVKTYMQQDDWYLPVNTGSGEVVHGAIDSLMAFLPGTQVLAGDVTAAAKLHLNFYRLWRRFGAMPENFDMRTLLPRPGAHHGYPLRPEFIESTYFLYRATRDPFYLEVGWRVMQDINSLTRTKCGFAAVADVTVLQPWSLEDRMDSFFLSETLKYLYLLFDEDNFLNRGEYLFNTEGHPIPLSISPPAESVALGVWIEPQECSAADAQSALELPKDQIQLVPMRAKAAPPTPQAPNKQHQSSVPLPLVTLPTAPQYHLIVTDPAALQVSAVASEGTVVQFELVNQILVHDPSDAAYVASPALFGPELNDTCLHAPATHVDGYESCSTYAHSVEGRVVITDRGYCNFIQKVLLAQSAGALAVLVCDIHEPDKLISMEAQGEVDRPVVIPSLFLAKGSCAALRAALQDSDGLVRIEQSAALPFGVQLPFVHSVVKQQGVAELNSIVSALLSSLPRLPQIALQVRTQQQQQQQHLETVSADSATSESESECTRAPAPPPAPQEHCPWRAHSRHQCGGVSTTDACGEAREYIIAPPLASDTQGAERGANEERKRE